MKLYGDFTKRDWLDAFGVEEHQIPLLFILHGVWNHEENLNLWKDILKEELWLPKWNTVIGKYKGSNIGFANVYGSPIATRLLTNLLRQEPSNLYKTDTLAVYPLM